MDDSWGNILYLVVMALFVIIGALKKKKPRVPVNPSGDGEVIQQPASSSGRGLESFFGALLGNEIPKPYVQTIEDVGPDREETMMEEYTRKEKLKVEAREEKKNSVFTDLKSFYDEDKVENEIMDDEADEIDWRKAIIYKEILDRKYN